MDATREETTNTLAGSKEMVKFFRALAAFQANTIFHIMQGENEEDMRQRADMEAERLINLITMNSIAHQCGAGTIWDEVLQTCVPIQ